MRKSRNQSRRSADRKQRGPKSEQAKSGGSRSSAGRSTSLSPQLFSELVVRAAALCGHSQTVWVQEKDAFGNRMWQTTTNSYGRVVFKRDTDGNPIPVMKQIRRCNGDDEVLGYLVGLAEEHPSEFRKLLMYVRPTMIRPTDADDAEKDRAIRTLDDVRAALTKRGLAADYFISELESAMTPQPAQQPLRPRPRLIDEETKRKPKFRKREYDDRGNLILPDDQQPEDEVRPVRVAEPYYKNESIDADRDVDPDDDFGDDDRYR
jgi:hypothetical protein